MPISNDDFSLGRTTVGARRSKRFVSSTTSGSCKIQSVRRNKIKSKGSPTNSPLILAKEWQQAMQRTNSLSSPKLVGVSTNPTKEFLQKYKNKNQNTKKKQQKNRIKNTKKIKKNTKKEFKKIPKGKKVNYYYFSVGKTPIKSKPSSVNVPVLSKQTALTAPQVFIVDGEIQ